VDVGGAIGTGRIEVSRVAGFHMLPTPAGDTDDPAQVMPNS